MKYRALSLLGLALALVGTAFADPPGGPSSVAEAPTDLIVKVRSVKDPAGYLATLVKGQGKVFSRDARNGKFRIRVEDAAKLVEMQQLLSKNPAVESVVPVTSSMSLSMLDQRINRIKAKAGIKEEAGQQSLGYLDALRHFINQRAYPSDVLDAEALNAAATHRDRMSPTRFAKPSGMSKLSTPTWTFVGPKNLSVSAPPMAGPSPTAGRVNAVAWHPTDPNILYVGAAGGGLWRSTDAGLNWTPLTDHWPMLYVSSIAIDHTNPNVIYVGTGDFDGSTPYSNGIMKSTDGGATWTNIGAGIFSQTAVKKILIDPDNTQIITIATGRGQVFNGGLYRSTNGGATWTNVLPSVSGAWTNVTVGALHGVSRLYYAAIGGSLRRLYRSSDRGATWTLLTIPSASAGFFDTLDVATSKLFPNTAYLLSGGSEKIYKTIDAGATWTDISAGFQFGHGSSNWNQQWYDWFIETSHAAGQDVIYVGLLDIAQSINGGASWRSVGQVFTGPTTLTHTDQHAMTMNPNNPDQALVGNDGGIYRFNFDPTADTWSFTTLDRVMGNTQFYAADYHPTNADIMLGGIQDNSSPISLGDLENWTNRAPGDGGFAAIDPSLPSTQYITTQFLQIYKTADSWATPYSVITPPKGNEPAQFIAPIAMDPAGRYLYAGTNWLYRYDRTTNAWTSHLGGTALTTSGGISTITVAIGDSNRIYTGSGTGQVWMSTNFGVSFTQIQTGSPGLPNKYITSIRPNPTNPNDVVVTVSGTGSGHVWRCKNVTAGTRVWTNVSGAGSSGLPDVPANDLTWENGNWHVATDVGVFTTLDSGANWTNTTAPLGLPNVRCNAIKFVPGTGYLNVATFGRGIWRIQPPMTTLSALTISPTAVRAPISSTGTVTLSSSADSNTVVTLSSSDPSAVVPPSMTVPAGQSSANFTITTSNNTVNTKTAVIKATYGSEATSASLSIRSNDNASFVSQSVPSTMTAGQTYAVSVTFKNTGGTTWTNAGQYKLMAQNPADNTTWIPARLNLGTSETVAPNANKTWSFNVTAPTTPGTYNFQFQMVHSGVHVFGVKSTNVSITVSAGTGTNGGTFVSQTPPPSTMAAGSTANVSVTMLNSGTKTWSQASNYNLGSRNPVDNLNWGTKRWAMATGTSAAPGTNYTFTRTITAPYAAGTYNFQWKLVSPNGWFGDLTPNVVVTVTAVPNSAEAVSQSGVPSTIAAGGTFTATVTMKNVGTNTWTTPSYKLGAVNPINNTNWGVNRVDMPAGSSIAPNGQVTFTRTFTAPSTPGTYWFQWQMIQSGVAFFGQRTPVVKVIVT